MQLLQHVLLTNFVQCTRLALQRGWFVEQWARRGSLNHLYLDLAKEYSKTMRIRYMDEIPITAVAVDRTAEAKVNAFKSVVGAELAKLQTALLAVWRFSFISKSNLIK